MDLGERDPAEVYKLLSLCVQPRPIAWVSTVSAGGKRNLAPFSFFTVASRSPATVVISIGPRSDGSPEPKDTLRNLRETGELVVNIPAARDVEAVSLTSSEVPAGIDEIALAGLTAIPSVRVGPATVRGALAALECRVVAEHQVGTDVVVYAEVEEITLRDGLVDERLHVDTAAAGFIGRLAGPFFTVVDSSLPQRSGIGVDPPVPAAR